MLVVNCKNYRGISAENLMSLAAAAAAAVAKYHIDVAIAPPHHLLGLQAGPRVRVLAPHVDAESPGSTTGYVIPELLADAGVSGSILNHSEHRLDPAAIPDLIERLRGLGMMSVLCVRDVEETAAYAPLRPDYIAIEPPDLIGTGRSVSTERPELISEAAESVRDTGTTLLCGAGIVSGGDVRRAVELGAAGILVASGVIKAPDPAAALDDLAQSMANR
jgi:triosephosphate isomerase